MCGNWGTAYPGAELDQIEKRNLKLHRKEVSGRTSRGYVDKVTDSRTHTHLKWQELLSEHDRSRARNPRNTQNRRESPLQDL
jgi:hypothetical protein